MVESNETKTGKIRSMTGFGRATETGDSGEITVTVRAVNHRNLEQSFRIPERLWEMESSLRGRVSESLERGKVDVSIRSSESSRSMALSIDSDLARELVNGLTGLAATTGIPFQPRLETIVGIPGVISTSTAVEDLDDDEKERVLRLLGEALEKVLEMRRTEGATLARDIAPRLDAMESRTREIEQLREQILAEQTESLRKRVQSLVEELDATLLEDRLAMEVAVMADKTDIAEETTRLLSHLDQMKSLLDSEGSVGRKMDFLCQEMTREVNTIGSKSRATELKNHVIELKAEIERVREQVQNVE